jgi:hypothetical protein
MVIWPKAAVDFLANSKNDFVLEFNERSTQSIGDFRLRVLAYRLGCWHFLLKSLRVQAVPFCVRLFSVTSEISKQKLIIQGLVQPVM